MKIHSGTLYIKTNHLQIGPMHANASNLKIWTALYMKTLIWWHNSITSLSKYKKTVIIEHTTKLQGQRMPLSILNLKLSNSRNLKNRNLSNECNVIILCNVMKLNKSITNAIGRG